MTPAVFLGISAAFSAASGVVGYLGAQQQAAAAENQATAAENQAAYNAQVAQNNAVAQAGDESFQQSVAQYNAAATNQERERALRDHRTKVQQKLASAEAQAGRSGMFDYSFDDVLRSEALLLERQEVDILSSGAEKSYEYTTQGNLSEMRENRALEVGRTQSGLILSEGRNRASAFRGQASSARFGGIGSLVSGFGQAGATASGIEF